MTGVELARLRTASGITAAEVARELGVNQSSVCRLEQRRTLQPVTVRRYVEALERRLAAHRERHHALTAKVAELAAMAGSR